MVGKNSIKKYITPETRKNSGTMSGFSSGKARPVKKGS